MCAAMLAAAWQARARPQAAGAGHEPGTSNQCRFHTPAITHAACTSPNGKQTLGVLREGPRAPQGSVRDWQSPARDEPASASRPVSAPAGPTQHHHQPAER